MPHSLPPRESRVQLLAVPAGTSFDTVPAWTAQQRAQAGEARPVVYCVPNQPGPDGTRLHWLDGVHARGWIQLPSHPQGVADEAGLAAHAQEALNLGFVGADAVLLAFLRLTDELPRLSWDTAPVFAPARAHAMQGLDLYAITDHVPRLEQALAAGVRTVQLRIKRPAQPDDAWQIALREALTRGIAASRAAGAQCFVNDHWALAAELGANAVHLGQEDLMALGDEGRQRLLASGVALGISSHSVWEVCRARALSPRYVACGPVWPTTTKDMPWVPQGLDNLAWWCRHAGAPVVAIGGILSPEQARQAAACGADGICLVRALGDDPARRLPAYAQALAAGRQSPASQAPDWPHPTLPVG
jgi:thiamine-phosphate diphosphorylase